MNNRVFITDGHWRKTLAAVRGLGQEGVRVTVGETTRLATAIFSRYCRESVAYPSPVHHPSDFLDHLRKALTKKPYQMLLPMEDETVSLLSRHLNEFSRLTYLPIVPFEKWNIAHRKDHILRLAERLGIPIPKTWYVQDLGQINMLKDRIPYPAVIKPVTGSGAVGIRYPKNPVEFIRDYQSVHMRFPFPLVQERIPSKGTGYGASFLFNEAGEVKASFMHKRLREYPPTGGASTLRESVRRDDIRDMGRALLKALDWYGVAMVEFKLDPRDNIPKLMEVNPRFWGSLSLAISAGVNFPYLLYRMSKGNDFQPVEQYSLGKRCRWLLPGDILHYIHNPHRKNLSPSFFRFWDRDTTYDILSLYDPLPVLGRIMTPLTFFYDHDMKKRLIKRKK
ncbi:MAG: ATP-grasp domain-containing protein [Deltaproteobacteria bacterium]|nr:ATP-grasp domain-containing protein [Deltaproteobacteria bacterium]